MFLISYRTLTGNQSRYRTFPILSLLSGIVFVLAGLAAYFHFETNFSIALIFIIAGAAVVLIGVTGFRTHGWEIAIFVISLIVLGGVVSTNYFQTNTRSVYTYSVASLPDNISGINIMATTGVGSINIGYSTNSDLAYQVTFEDTVFGLPFTNLVTSNFTLTNQTTNNILYLNATSSSSKIVITLGMKYITNIEAITGTGSIDLTTPSSGETNLQSVSLDTSTGSVNAKIVARNISGISLKSSTGSINFASDYLSPSSTHVPISISSSVGSVEISMKTANTAAVGINATNSLGSITQHLSGFTILTSTNNHLVASAGNINSAEKSFLVTIDSGLGSININGELVSPQ